MYTLYCAYSIFVRLHNKHQHACIRMIRGWMMRPLRIQALPRWPDRRSSRTAVLVSQHPGKIQWERWEEPPSNGTSADRIAESEQVPGKKLVFTSIRWESHQQKMGM